MLSPEGAAEVSADALVAALVELERHVGEAGWDQPPRLFALVLTDVFAEAEPALAAELGLRRSADGGLPGALTAIEQEAFADADDLLGALSGLEWPSTVFGCAVSTERTFLPAALEAEIPDEPAAAAAFVADHPQRQDLRVVVGADRAGNSHGVARLVSAPDELLGGAQLVPGLGEALAHTLSATPDSPGDLDEPGNSGPRPPVGPTQEPDSVSAAGPDELRGPRHPRSEQS